MNATRKTVEMIDLVIVVLFYLSSKESIVWLDDTPLGT